MSNQGQLAGNVIMGQETFWKNGKQDKNLLFLNISQNECYLFHNVLIFSIQAIR